MYAYGRRAMAIRCTLANHHTATTFTAPGADRHRHLAVIDADGLAALSMRAVARSELGMTMSAHRYVADRDELEVMVVDLVLASGSGCAASSPSRRVTVLTERVRDAAAGHPSGRAARADPSPSLAGVAAVGEAVLAALTDWGHTGKRRVPRSVRCWPIWALQVENFGALTGRVPSARPASTARFRCCRRQLHRRRHLPAGRVPRGLDILVRGLDPRHPSEASGRQERNEVGDPAPARFAVTSRSGCRSTTAAPEQPDTLRHVRRTLRVVSGCNRPAAGSRLRAAKRVEHVEVDDEYQPASAAAAPAVTNSAIRTLSRPGERGATTVGRDPVVHTRLTGLRQASA